MRAKKSLKTVKKNIFSRQELEEYGFYPYSIQKSLREGRLVKVSWGIYKMTEPEAEITHEERFREATAIVGLKSAICLLSALEYYNLTDQITDSVWIMVPDHKRSQSQKVTLFRTRNPYWSIGVKKRKGYKITSLERTLVDSLAHPQKIAKLESIEALKRALSKKLTTLTKVYKMAKTLGFEERLRPVFEVLM